MSEAPITLNENSNGVVDAQGFALAGVACDIRDKGDLQRKDVALIYSERPCTAAAVFTTNDVKAAPVRYGQALLQGKGVFHGIVANSGNANACTGEQGEKNTLLMAEAAQKACGAPEGSFFVGSTGRIGRQLPMDKLLAGIEAAGQSLAANAEQSLAAAWAILTSDTRPKVVTASFELAGKTVTVAGMGKGAGMIEPNMATMLAFIGTDAAVAQPLLQQALCYANARSFNTISVDGDMSTNDTVVVLANGASGVEIREEDSEAFALFKAALHKVCLSLAEKMVGDGERVTKFVRVQVLGAPSDAAAEKVARAIGNSLLVKTSWYGSDPNWGRLLDAAGYARVGLVENKLDLDYDDIPVIRQGEPQDENLQKWKAAVAKKHFAITLNLNLGQGAFTLISADLSEGYVAFNKSE